MKRIISALFNFTDDASELPTASSMCAWKWLIFMVTCCLAGIKSLFCAKLRLPFVYGTQVLKKRYEIIEVTLDLKRFLF